MIPVQKYQTASAELQSDSWLTSLSMQKNFLIPSTKVELTKLKTMITIVMGVAVGLASVVAICRLVDLLVRRRHQEQRSKLIDNSIMYDNLKTQIRTQL